MNKKKRMKCMQISRQYKIKIEVQIVGCESAQFGEVKIKLTFIWHHRPSGIRVFFIPEQKHNKIVVVEKQEVVSQHWNKGGAQAAQGPNSKNLTTILALLHRPQAAPAVITMYLLLRAGSSTTSRGRKGQFGQQPSGGTPKEKRLAFLWPRLPSFSI